MARRAHHQRSRAQRPAQDRWRTSGLIGFGLALSCSSSGVTAGADAGDAGGTWGAPEVAVSEVESPLAVTLDGSAIYWTGEDGTVEALDKVEVEAESRLVAEEQGRVLDIVADQGWLYWVDAEADRVVVYRPEDEQVMPMHAGGEEPYRLAINDSFVAWICRAGGRVMVTTRDGAGWGWPVAAPVDPVALALDDTHVHYAESDFGTIRSVPLMGGVGQVLAVGQYARSLALAEDVLYWAAGAQIRSLDPTTGEVAVLVERAPAADRLTVAGGYLYWTSADPGTVSRAPKQGGEAELIAAEQDEPWDVAVDSRAVYWAAHGAGAIMKAAWSP